MFQENNNGLDASTEKKMPEISVINEKKIEELKDLQQELLRLENNISILLKIIGDKETDGVEVPEEIVGFINKLTNNGEYELSARGIYEASQELVDKYAVLEQENLRQTG